jgi:hypothetical protein
MAILDYKDPRYWIIRIQCRLGALKKERLRKLLMML